jgi:hypothetical protein
MLDFTLFVTRCLMPQYCTQHTLTGSHMPPDHHVFERCHFTEQAQILKRTRDTGLRN